MQVRTNNFDFMITPFIHAFSGIRNAFLSERNIRIHVLATVIVIGLGIYFDVSSTDWMILIMLM